MSEKIPEDSMIISNWILKNGKVFADANCERVNGLISNYLKHIARSPDKWSDLYRDPVDGRYWETVFLEGELHGGGPISLQIVTATTAKESYGIEI